MQILIGDDPELFRRSQRQKPRHRLLDHGLLAVERKQLLGSFLAAQRPKPRASPSGQNYGIEVRVLGHVYERSQFASFPKNLANSTRPIVIPRGARDPGPCLHHVNCRCKREPRSLALLGMTIPATTIHRADARSCSIYRAHLRSSALTALVIGNLKLNLVYSLVSGSGSVFPGTNARKNSSVHCGRTLNSPMLAGITAASPFARVTGSAPGASITPQPSTATRIWTELFPESPRVVSRSGSFASNLSTTKYGASINGSRRFLPPFTCKGAGRTTLPDRTFSFTAAI